MLFYQKRSVPFRFVSFDGLFNWALPEAHILPRPRGRRPVNRQQFYAGRPMQHTQFALGNFSFCQDSRFDWHLREQEEEEEGGNTKTKHSHCYGKAKEFGSRQRHAWLTN